MLCEVTEDGSGTTHYKMLTMRNKPRMALINTAIRGDKLVVWVDSRSWWRRKTGIEISLTTTGESMLVDVKLHEAQVTVVDMGRQYSQFFSDFLGCNVRLVREYRGSRAVIHKAHITTPSQARVGLADQYPLLIMSRATIKAVNAGLAESGQSALPVEQFRPNIIIDGLLEAFEEDTWHRIVIGNVEVEIIGPCTRCLLPNVNLSTGRRSEQNQPWKWMHATRCVDVMQPRKPVVGVHAMFRESESNNLNVGDLVRVKG